MIFAIGFYVHEYSYNSYPVCAPRIQISGIKQWPTLAGYMIWKVIVTIFKK
jgi:hypothetical protein